ncbi:MAG: RNA methyltransferase [Polyangiaceae bacterium]
MRRVSLALLHFPVLDRGGDTVTTAMTNLDLHDMSRSARTFGLEAMFVVHPIEAQRELAARIRDHWVLGSGRRRIPDRATALELVRIVPLLEDAIADLGGPDAVELWTTAAAARGRETVGYHDARARLESDDPRHVLLLFGTGWGLAGEVVDKAHAHLAPVAAARDTGFNHLSVRAACAIVLDRLLGHR